jgi:hypothetical protein
MRENRPLLNNTVYAIIGCGGHQIHTDAMPLGLTIFISLQPPTSYDNPDNHYAFPLGGSGCVP